MKSFYFKWLMVATMVCIPVLKSLAQPIPIGSVEDLRKIGVDAGFPMNGDYVLMNDIDLSGVNDWVPIGMHTGHTFNVTGNALTNFSGTFDGKGFAIKNLTYSFNGTYTGTFGTDELTGGLFGRIAGGPFATTNKGIVKNLELRNFNITGNCAGALAASLAICTINQVAVIGCTITGGSEVGGLSGRVNNSPHDIRNCYVDATTKIIGGSKVGGIIGSIGQNAVTGITNCYVAATLKGTGSDPVYGLVGNSLTAGGFARPMSVFVMAQAEEGTTLHPFCPLFDNVEERDNYPAMSYFACSEYFPSAAPANAKSLAELKDKATYVAAGWDFDAIWQIEAGKFPVFKKPTDPSSDAEAVAAAKTAIESGAFTVAQATANTEAAVKTWLVTPINTLIAATGITVSEANITVSNFKAAAATNGSFNFSVALSKGSASGTANKSGTITAALDPDGTPISSYEELNTLVRANLGGKYYLKNDIDMSGVTDWVPIGMESGRAFNATPAQGITALSNFTGTFDGKGYAIKNLTYSFSGKYEGLAFGTFELTGGIFGRIAGTVKDLELRNLTITGGIGTGALCAGIAANGIVERVSVIGCTLSGDDEVGGIAGRTNGGLQSVKNCYVDATTTIKGKAKVGGIIGHIGQTITATLTNCYVAATIEYTGATGNSYGVIGHCTNNENGLTLNSVFVMARGNATLQPFCYLTAAGTIKAGSTYFACSDYFPKADYPSLYPAEEGDPSFVKTLQELQDKATYVTAGWDFDEIWQIEAGKFPILKWQKYSNGIRTVKAGQFWTATGVNNCIEVTALEPLFLSVYDITGKLLFAAQVNTQVSIPAGQGIYILKARSAGKEATQKLIVK